MIKPFLKYLLHEKTASKHTISSYETDLLQCETHIKSMDSALGLAEVNHQMLRSWIVSLVESGISPRSVNRKMASLKSFYKFLLYKKMIKENPAKKLKALKTPKVIPQFIIEEEMTSLLDRVAFGDDFKGLRNQLIIELLYSTGIRLSELINLKVCDIDFHQSTIKVLGKRNKERIVPLTKSSVRLIGMYLAKRTFEDVFLVLTDKGKKCYPTMVYKTVKRYLGYVSKNEKRSPHVLRHTYATHLLNNGADLNAVKELLGHTSLAATQVYTHNSLDRLKSIFDQAHPKA